MTNNNVVVMLYTEKFGGAMRKLFGAVILFIAVGPSFAAEVGCAALAVSYRDASWLMSAVSFARLRKCVEDGTWKPATPAPATSAPVPPPNDKDLFRLGLGPKCARVAALLAGLGAAKLTEGDRAEILSCIDKAIVDISTTPRPGNQAHQPQVREGRV